MEFKNSIEKRKAINLPQLASTNDIVKSESKEYSLYNLINVNLIAVNDIRKLIADELTYLNAAMNEKLQLNSAMLKLLIETILSDFDTITPAGLRKAIRQGISGQYGQIYQMNVNTVLTWIRNYLAEDKFHEETGEPLPGTRTERLRKTVQEKREQEKKEFAIIGNRNLASALRAALNLNNKVREFKPNPKHLDLFAKMVNFFTDEEIDQAIEDWKKRQRPQYLEILENEKTKRHGKDPLQ